MLELEAVAAHLHGSALLLLRRLRREGDTTGMTAARISTLHALVELGPLPLGSLAAVEQVRPATMSRIVSRLERDGLVRREQLPRDKRSVRVRVTAKGVRALGRARTDRVEGLAERLERLTPKELAVLREATEIIDVLFG